MSFTFCYTKASAQWSKQELLITVVLITPRCEVLVTIEEILLFTSSACHDNTHVLLDYL